MRSNAWYDDPPEEEEVGTRIVEVPASNQHEGMYTIKVELVWVCPKCNRVRGNVYRTFSYDGSRRVECDGWTNPCGHVDKYDAVRAEAREATTPPPADSAAQKQTARHEAEARALDRDENNAARQEVSL